MPKIIDYAVVIGENKDELVSLMIGWIQRGWQPLGGVSGYSEDTFCGPRSRFAQAVVKYEETQIKFNDA